MNNIKLTEVVAQRSLANEGTVSSRETYTLREVYINPEHVVCMRADKLMKRHLTENLLPDDLDQRQEFTKIYINRGHTGLDITVVGAPSMIQNKIFESAKKIKREILKG
jgi:hypothetical protein